MHQYSEILDVYAREILDSRGNPTVEVEVLTEDAPWAGRPCPREPAPASMRRWSFGTEEKRYGGKGVQNAVEHVNTILADCIIGENIYQQAEIDRKLIRADGSENKSRLGANAILGVSMAVAHAAAKSLEIPLFRYLGGSQAPAPSGTDVQRHQRGLPHPERPGFSGIYADARPGGKLQRRLTDGSGDLSSASETSR